MAVFEVESWLVAEGKDKEHAAEMRRWLSWVKAHRELFPEWKSVRYFEKLAAGADSNRHLVIWEYESLAAYETYKTRRKDYQGPYAEYKENDPYYKGVFIHSMMGMEFWKDVDRDLWIETPA
jgi:hypothetical protein